MYFKLVEKYNTLSYTGCLEQNQYQIETLRKISCPYTFNKIVFVLAKQSVNLLFCQESFRDL